MNNSLLITPEETLTNLFLAKYGIGIQNASVSKGVIKFTVRTWQAAGDLLRDFTRKHHKITVEGIRYNEFEVTIPYTAELQPLLTNKA
jgi:hypothetical protein